MTMSNIPICHETLFENPFQIEDLMVFDDNTLHTMLMRGEFGLTVTSLAHCLHSIDTSLLTRIKRNLSPQQRWLFVRELERPLPQSAVEDARRKLLDSLFWELTYWKTPELYEELT